MTNNRLKENSLDRYLGLSAWKLPISTTPLPGPSHGDVAWSRDAEIDRIRARVRTTLARRSGVSKSCTCRDCAGPHKYLIRPGTFFVAMHLTGQQRKE
jgi:hypothetical protein